jgi:DHA2 family multidrug resistance protein
MLERGERYDWFESRFVTALAITSAVSFLLLLWRELTAKEPVINFRVLHSRQLTAGVIIAAVLGFALFGSIFVLPVFLQTLHGFTANQTGMVILPGAIASAVTIAFVGRNLKRMDTRAAVAFGAVLFFWAMYELSLLSLDAGTDDLFWPLIIRGVGLGLIFVPLTGAAMADLSVSELSQGTAMFNLTRQLGGSMGIAIMATSLSRFTSQAKARLAEHVAINDPLALGRIEGLTRAIIAKGGNPVSSRQQALMIVDRQLQAQASVLGFSKVYIWSGITLLAAVPLLLLFRTGKARGAPGGMH